MSTYFHALMLTFLAGMVGFCLTGDIFDMFVWFELMGVSAYALTAYRPEERGPLQGALNFAITGSLGAYLTLSGIGLIYGRTGALNMAQIAADLARQPPDGLVVVGFRADHRRAAGQERDRAVSLLAGGCARGRPYAGMRPLLRRNGRARRIQG